MIRSLTRGSSPVLLHDEIVANAISEVVNIPTEPGVDSHSPKNIQWTYEPGATPPSAVQLDLRGSLTIDANGDLVNPIVIDTYNTFGTRTTRTADVTNFPFLDINVTNLAGPPVPGISAAIYF